MNNQPRTYRLKDLAPFKGLSDKTIKDLETNSKILGYKIGQPLSKRNIIQNCILLIIEGEARVLGKSGEDEFTIAKIGVGNFVGLVSLLRAAPCEEIITTKELKVLSIPDNIIINLYTNALTFREWCNSNIFPSEIDSLINSFKLSSNWSQSYRQKIFLELFKQVKIHNSKQKNFSNTNEIKLLLASENCINKKIGDEINIKDTIESRPPFQARVHEVPLILFQKCSSTEKIKVESQNNTKQTTIDIFNGSDQKLSYGPSFPSQTDIDLGEYKLNKEFKLIKATGFLNEATANLQMLSNQLELPFRKDAIERILRDTNKGESNPSLDLLGGIASSMGLSASGAKIPAKAGIRLQTPAIVRYNKGFALLHKSSQKGITLASPSKGWIEINVDQLEKEFPEGIEVLLVEKSNLTQNKKFNINWFWPVLKKYQGILIQVLIASFVVQLFTLANPLLIQVIIDKVISQRSLDTLQILGVALVIVTIMGGVISSLRTFLFTETTNRIDTRLGAEVIDHLLRLPLNYFDKRPVGELGSRVAELEKIRNFLTGQALTTFLDACFSVIYILVMVLYSWLLTFIALAVVPLQIAITLLGTPLIRRQIREAAIENAKTQSHLVEVLTGVQTVKAQNVEIVSRWKWQNLYHKYIARSFERTITGTALNEFSNVLQQLSQLLVLWIGASLVLNGSLSLGQLIAFRIISSYVTQPLLRLTTIWQNIQELRVSFERLADIIDTNEESTDSDKTNIPLPQIKGNVDFSNVSFSFGRNQSKVLSNINIHIDAGKFIGIVGQSGSGKSTLMKLLPRLYEPQEGKIKIDGYEITKVELYSLRRQVGIVPQDPLLFAGTISENIALTDPEVSSEAIVKVAKMAMAHDFIMNLPNGYSTNVGERGANLSGGQRQRIAIARTLLSNPNLLILDEATSALDYDTERKVCNSLKAFCKEKTVFFITHRLSTIQDADSIMMLHNGVVEETGSHKELMSHKGRYYALFNQQAPEE